MSIAALSRRAILRAMHVIRLATAGDAAALAALYAPFVVDAATSFELEPPGSGEMARRIESICRHTPWLVWEDAGRIAGYAYASRHRERAAYQWSVDVSVYVRADDEDSAHRVFRAVDALARIVGDTERG